MCPVDDFYCPDNIKQVINAIFKLDDSVVKAIGHEKDNNETIIIYLNNECEELQKCIKTVNGFKIEFRIRK